MTELTDIEKITDIEVFLRIIEDAVDKCKKYDSSQHGAVTTATALMLTLASLVNTDEEKLEQFCIRFKKTVKEIHGMLVIAEALKG